MERFSSTRKPRLSPAKQLLLEKRLRGEKDADNSLQVIWLPRPQRIPLSYAQQRLWFIDQLEPGRAMYNIPSALKVRGELRRELLGQALGEVVRRHEALRTRFEVSDGQPMQVIDEAKPVVTTEIDLSGLEEREREKEARRIAGEEAAKGFDLSRGQLLRAGVVRLGEQDQIVLITMHHIVSDEWSIGVIIREFSSLYETFSQGLPSTLPELDLHYADYAVWQRRWLQGAELERQLEYWKKRLDGIPRTLDLPTDNPRPSERSYKGAAFSFELSKELSETIETLSRGEGATLFMVLLAALGVLLNRYSGQHDIVVGSPIAGRNRGETEGLIGFFVNLLMLRIVLRGEPTFRVLVKRVREVCLEAYAHQDLPFDKLVEVLNPARGVNQAPFLRVSFSLQEIPNLTGLSSDLEVSAIKSDLEMARTDLVLQMWKTGQLLCGSMGYSTDLFESDTIRKMVLDFQTVLECVIDDPDKTISELPELQVKRPVGLEKVRPGQYDFEQLLDRSNLTCNQMLVWLGQTLHPELPLYNIVVVYEISGDVNPQYFQQAFQLLAESSDVLRTTIRAVDGIPVQAASDEPPDTLEYIDLTKHIRPHPIYDAWLKERISLPVDLEAGLTDSVLIKISEEKSFLYLRWHQIISDGASCRLAVRHMSELYERLMAGESVSEPNLPTYRSYVESEREDRGTVRYQEAREYWEEKLKSPAEPIEFYGKAQLKLVTEVERIVYRLGEEGTQKLKRFARREGVFNKTEDLTLVNTLLTALFVYLYRISGNQTVSVGTIYHNRRSASAREIMGLLMEAVALRIEIDERETFMSLLGKVKDDFFDSVRRCPYAIGNPEQKKNYEVLFNYNKQSISKFAGMPIEAHLLSPDYQTDSLILVVYDFIGSGNLAFEFNFRKDVFNEEDRERAIGHYLRTLNALMEEPEQTISGFSLLQAEEERRILYEFNPRPEALPEYRSVTEVFEEQVERTPDRAAVVFRGEIVTYRGLNERSNQVAHSLQSHGIGPEEVVGVCVDRGVDWAVGLLAILKAGGAYLPLDAMYPKGRLEYMLKDTKTRLILTQKRLKELFIGELVTDLSMKAICLDAEEPAVENCVNPVNGVERENLAYVIYTSGSTGRPKGVMINHQNLVNARFAYERAYELEAASAYYAQIASQSFDVSTGDWIRALCTGGKLLICPQEIILSPPEFYQMMIGERVDSIECTPGFFNGVVRYLKETKQKLDAVKLLVFGADSCYMNDVEEARDVCNWARIFNSYGVTEATIDSTNYEVIEGISVAGSLAPIGRPMMNARIYILDREMSSVPRGIKGEIYIGGGGAGRGYVNRPDLTAERYLPSPFGDGEGERVYKTGDLASYLSSGDIELFGRQDDQIKVRGYRVEIGEIEAALRQHENVRESVVMAREDEPGRKKLVAYVALDGKNSVTSSELSGYLREKLPDYMAPAGYVFMERLPLTANGKVNRKALPAPEVSQEVVEGEGPRTVTEEIVAGIWSEILRLERVGMRQNFFDLGGHSLLATQVISRVRAIFQIELPLKVLFEHPSVRELAERVERERFAGMQVKAPPIAPVSRDGDLPLSYAQQRLWFIDQLEPGRAMYNIPSALRVRGGLRHELLERILCEVLRRHEVLRTRFEVRDGQPAQVIDEAMPVAVPVVDVSGLGERRGEQEAGRIVREEANRGFNLSQGPLLRAGLVRLGVEDQIVLLTMHHIISDGWSMRTLVREVSALHDAYSKGAPSPLPELAAQYADYAVWQRQWLQGEALEEQISYWRRQLEGVEVLDLSTDHHRPATQGYRGGRESIVLSEELTDAIVALSRREGVTLFMLLMAVFQTLLSRYTGQEELTVGTPIAGRNLVEIENLIGFFVNTLVMKGDLRGNPTFREYLNRVREMSLGAYGNQDVPFEKLVEELRPERNLDRSPLFQVMLNVLSLEREQIDFHGLKVETEPVELETAKFDLTLYVMEEHTRVRLVASYNKELFLAERIREMLRQVELLLEQVVEDVCRPLSDYTLITKEARMSLPIPDRSESLSEPQYELTVGTFLSLANQIPGQHAVCQGDQVLTYRELSERAVKLAQILVDGGLKPGEVVGIVGPPSLGLITSLISTLLSGGVLLTIDRNLPILRQKFMLSQAGAKYLLYIDEVDERDDLIEALEVDVVFRVNPEYGDAPGKICRGDTNLPDLSGDDPAYLFFTSGTTGVPKGVLGNHKGLSHFLAWQRETFAIGPQDRCAQLIGISFDVVLRDIFLPLTSGATLCLPENPDVVDHNQVVCWLSRENITILHGVPSLAQSWLMSPPSETPIGALRWTFFAGEPLSDALVYSWRRAFPGTGVVNLYGPTETTMAKCFYIIPPNPPPGIQPIGQPLPGAQALILRESGILCGIGELGEIVLRTPFRTLGYINAQPEGRKSFVKNHFRDDEDDLLYYTGDLGRYRLDGSLEILGRLDHQVKIRGVRIELDEVAAVLLLHSNVKACVVVSHRDTHSQDYLVAYVVLDVKNDSVISELRSHVGKYLPSAMTPSLFEVLEELPLTANGKIDRRALPTPKKRSDPGTGYVAPRTPIEEDLALIWQELLKEEKIGIYDNFFERGGHSLLLTQLSSRIRKAFDTEVPLRALFDAPTIVGMTKAIVAGQINSMDGRLAEAVVNQLKQLSAQEISALLAEK